MEGEYCEARIASGSDITELWVDGKDPISIGISSESVDTDSSVQIPDLDGLVFGVTDNGVLWDEMV